MRYLALLGFDVLPKAVARAKPLSYAAHTKMNEFAILTY
jgi:hypothetical protein